MQRISTITGAKHILLVTLLCIFFGFTMKAQTNISDYVIFGGTSSVLIGQTAPSAPGYGVTIGASNSVKGGAISSIGSYKLVQTTGGFSCGQTTFKTNIYSGGTVALSNSNTVYGDIAAANSGTPPLTGTILSVGTSANLQGKIDVNGNIVIGGGTVAGPVKTSGTYKLGSATIASAGSPTFPVLPSMPAITTFPSTGTSDNIIATRTIIPGYYGNLSISGNSIVTLNGPGVYVFKSIKTSGPNNSIIYNFNSTTSGNFLIYVIGDVNLNKTSLSMTGGSVTRIYTEVHGNGSTNTADKTTAFLMSNGSNGSGNVSGFLGALWVPYAAIKIGAPNGPSMTVNGSLWSGTQVNLLGGVTVTYANYILCSPPVITAQPTGATQNLCLNAAATPLSVTATGTGLTYQWYRNSANSNSGGTIIGGATSSNYAPLTTTAGMSYYYVVVSGTCTPVVTSNVSGSVTVNAPPAITSQPTTPTPTCTGIGIQTISITATGQGLIYSWRKEGVAVTNGGVISGQGTSTLTLTNAIATDAGSYDVVVSGSCAPTVTSSAVTVTVNALPTIVDAAGPDKPYNFDGSTTIGKSGLTGFTFKWTAPPGGLITTADNLATINVSAPGIYKLTLKSGAGCTSTDDVEVSNKVNKLIGSELTSVYWNNPTGLPSPFFIIENGYIRIDIIVQVNNYDYVLGLLQQRTPAFPVDYGLKNIVTNGVNGDAQDGSKLIITGDYPIANLLNLNGLGSYINFCRPYYQPFSNIGLVSSAGDTTMRSNLVRSGYKTSGSGIKIGVISNSFATITSATTPDNILVEYPGTQTFRTSTAAQDILSGDLSAVNVLQDYPIKSTDEGRAMLQIVHDVAPGAELYFRTGFLTAGDFATGIKQLTTAGCKVIVDDLTYLTEPFLKDGVVAKAVNDAKSLGVTYFSSAGNFANKSYEKDFKPVNAAAYMGAVAAPGFIGKTAHDFSGTGDIFQHITLPPGDYTIVLQWVDDIYSSGVIQGTKFDLDMFWTSNTDGTALKGFNRDNRFGDPLEILPFTITSATDASFLIVNNNPGTLGTAVDNPARIKYVIYRGDVKIEEFNEGTSTIVGQANALGAIAVGAARFDKAPPYLTTPLIENFSSIGGTKTEGAVRNKPDIVAPDGVNTLVKMGQDYSNALTGAKLDGYSNFFGTSAAAPHAAAVAALIMEGKKKFLNQDVSLATPDEIRLLLQKTAVDMETASNQGGTKFDFISGYGLIDADSAMRTFAAPTSTLIELKLPTAIVPCSGVSFTLTITGENFSRSTVVYLINSPTDTKILIPTFISSSEVSVTLDALACDGNPEIKAYTPPKAGTNGTDGGFSNSLYFFSAAITITANDVNKKYGETLTALSATIKVDGVLLQNTTPLLTLADIGLTNLTVTTAATSQSDVGTYITAFSQKTPDDPALSKKYSYKFTDGKVTIAKMPLRVTPNNITAAYGQSIGKVTFDYKFNELNVADPVALKSIIKSYHEAYLPKNTLAVIKDFKKPTSNYTLDTTYLRNMNMIASFNAVNNSRKFTLSDNNVLVPATANVLQNNLNAQYLVDVASESIYNYKINSATAKFSSVYPGINSKALLSDASISSDINTIGVVEAPGTLLSTKVTNGSLVQTINTPDGPIVPIAGGSLVQIIDATINGSSTDLAQYVNGQWVRITTDVNTHTTILNKLVNVLLRGANGLVINVDGSGNSTVQITNGSYSPILTNVLLRGANGTETLVTVVNGVDVQVPDGSLVELDNGDLLLFNQITYSVNPISNSAILRGLNALLRGANTLLRGANALLRGANGAILRGANGVEFGTESPVNNTSVIVDADDAKADGTGYAWLGSMFGINMITGLDVGKQYLVPGTLVNPNFDISYGLGEVDIAKAEITITPLPNTRDYDGSTTAAAIPTITIGALAGGDLAVLKEAYDNINAGTSKTMIPAVVSIVDALGASTTANYNVTPNPVANGVINKMPLNVTADPQSKSYDGLKFTAFTSTITGFVNNETSAVVSGAAAYTGAATSATAAGTYTITPAIGSLSATNYNFTPFVDGTLVINISNSTITVTGSTVTGSTSFTYTGLPQGPSTSIVTGSTGSVTYSYVGTGATSYAASATKPTNAGTYSVTATVAADGNYYAATSAATAFTISVSNSTITVTGSTSFTYTGLAQGPSTSTVTGSTGAVTYSYVGTSATSYAASAATPNNAGTYNVTATVAADANYNGATSSATAFVITASNSTITVTGSTSFTYKGLAQGPCTSTVTGSTGAVTYSYLGTGATSYAASATKPTNAGTYNVTATVAADANYNAANSTATAFTINKLIIQVKADDKFTFKGAQAPAFTGTITPGVISGDNPVGYSCTYNYQSSPAGLYTITPVLNNTNYTIGTITTGTLYVNPKGTGVDDVDVYVDCIQDRGSTYLPKNRRYVAHFYAKNLNNVPVYVPIGVDNQLSSMGSFDGSQQPIVFLPGTGTTRFSVPFDGTSLKWTVKTFEVNTLVTESATVSSSTSDYSCNYTYGATNSRVVSSNATPLGENETLRVVPTEIIPVGNVNVFPNPARSRTNIYISDDVINVKGLKLFDTYGKQHPVKGVRKISKHTIEIDMSGLTTGMYFIKVNGENGYKTVSVIKE